MSDYCLRVDCANDDHDDCRHTSATCSCECHEPLTRTEIFNLRRMLLALEALA